MGSDLDAGRICGYGTARCRRNCKRQELRVGKCPNTYPCCLKKWKVNSLNPQKDTKPRGAWLLEMATSQTSEPPFSGPSRWTVPSGSSRLVEWGPAGGARACRAEAGDAVSTRPLPEGGGQQRRLHEGLSTSKDEPEAGPVRHKPKWRSFYSFAWIILIDLVTLGFFSDQQFCSIVIRVFY